jgi:glycosyltransferase involved in cell wall biosynthesis
MLPQVSVCIFSYNYEKYIAQTIESVLDQQTNFPFEIIIGDDLSTDSTRQIANAYQQKYPERIRLSFNETNLGGTRNWIQTMSRAKGKYLALIDGDDYFIDQYKLQKQYDILEKDTAANLCFHGVREIFENDNNREMDVLFARSEYKTADILRQGWFIRTSSLFFRNGIIPVNPPDWVYEFPYRYDTVMIVLLSLNSKVINSKDVMTVWRRHDAGLSYVITRNHYKNYVDEKKLYKHLDELSDQNYTRAILSYMRKLRTGLVWTSIKGFSTQAMFDLGFSALNINYKLLFQLMANSIKTRFAKNNGAAN